MSEVESLPPKKSPPPPPPPAGPPPPPGPGQAAPRLTYAERQAQERAVAAEARQQRTDEILANARALRELRDDLALAMPVRGGHLVWDEFRHAARADSTTEALEARRTQLAQRLSESMPAAGGRCLIWHGFFSDDAEPGDFNRRHLAAEREDAPPGGRAAPIGAAALKLDTKVSVRLDHVSSEFFPGIDPLLIKLVIEGESLIRKLRLQIRDAGQNLRYEETLAPRDIRALHRQVPAEVIDEYRRKARFRTYLNSRRHTDAGEHTCATEAAGPYTVAIDYATADGEWRPAEVQAGESAAGLAQNQAHVEAGRTSLEVARWVTDLRDSSTACVKIQREVQMATQGRCDEDYDLILGSLPDEVANRMSPDQQVQRKQDALDYAKTTCSYHARWLPTMFVGDQFVQNLQQLQRPDVPRAPWACTTDPANGVFVWDREDASHQARSFREQMNAWAAEGGHAIYRMYVLGGAAHEFFLEQFVDRQGVTKFRLYQGYVGVYRLSDFLAPDLDRTAVPGDATPTEFLQRMQQARLASLRAAGKDRELAAESAADHDYAQCFGDGAWGRLGRGASYTAEQIDALMFDIIQRAFDDKIEDRDWVNFAGKLVEEGLNRIAVIRHHSAESLQQRCLDNLNDVADYTTGRWDPPADAAGPHKLTVWERFYTTQEFYQSVLPHEL